MEKLSKVTLAAIIVFLCGIVPCYGAAAAKDNVQVIVNGVKLAQAKAVLEKGETLIPFRALFEALGGKVGYDKETEALTGELDGEIMRLWLGEDIIEYKQKTYYLSNPIKTIHNRTYLPIRIAGEVLGFEVAFDKRSRTVTFTKFGFGQDETIKQLLQGFMKRNLEQPLKDLFIGGYEDLIYLNENLYEGYGPYRSFDTWVRNISYSSSSTAVVSAGYHSQTQVLDESVELRFSLLKAGGNWKISQYEWVHFNMQLPDDADITANNLVEKNPEAVQQILRDLSAYYKAMNEENYEQALQFTSPLFIADWNSKIMMEWANYENIIKHRFEETATTEQLLEARVLYMDDSYAAVHALILHNKQINGEKAEEPYKYEFIISMDLIDGKRWTYNSEIDINGDY